MNYLKKLFNVIITIAFIVFTLVAPVIFNEIIKILENKGFEVVIKQEAYQYSVMVVSIFSVLAMYNAYKQGKDNIYKTVKLTNKVRKSELEEKKLEEVKVLFSDYVVTLLKVNDLNIINSVDPNIEFNKKVKIVNEIYSNIEKQYSKIDINGVINNINDVNINEVSKIEKELLHKRKLLSSKYKQTYLYIHEFINCFLIEQVENEKQINVINSENLELRRNINDFNESWAELLPSPYNIEQQQKLKKSTEEKLLKLQDNAIVIQKRLNMYIAEINDYTKELRKCVVEYVEAKESCIMYELNNS